jgi:hypothetical protein
MPDIGRVPPANLGTRVSHVSTTSWSCPRLTFSWPRLLLPWNGCRMLTMVVIPGHLGRQSPAVTHAATLP